MTSQSPSPTKATQGLTRQADLRQMLVKKVEDVSIRSSTDSMRRPHSVYLDLAMPKKSASEIQLIPRRASKENLSALMASTAPTAASLLEARAAGENSAPTSAPTLLSGGGAAANVPSSTGGAPEGGYRGRSHSITQLAADPQATSQQQASQPPSEPLPDLTELIKGLDSDASFPNSYELEEKIVSSKLKHLRDLNVYIRTGRLQPVSTIALPPGAEQTIFLV